MSDGDDATKEIATEKKITKKASTMDMLMKAIESNTERKGISVLAIKNYIKENYPSASSTTLKTRLKSALSQAMEKDQIRRPKASSNKDSSLTGRYVLSEQKKVAVRAPKPANASKTTKAKQPKAKKTLDKKKKNNNKTPPKKSEKKPAKGPQTPAQVNAAIRKKLVKKAISASTKLNAKRKSEAASAKKPPKEKTEERPTRRRRLARSSDHHDGASVPAVEN